MKDLKNDVALLVAFKIQTVSTNTTTNGEIIDLQDYEGCTFVFQTGTVTDGDYLPLIEESVNSDLTSSNVVVDGDLIGTESNAGFTADDDDDKISTLGYRGSKRFVRFAVVSTNTSSGAVIGANVILSHPLTKKDITNLDAG